MGTEKAGYWIAVGVLALFVSNNFAARHQGDVRCLASRSLAALEQVSGRAPRLMAIAETMLGRSETRFAQTQTKLARVQTRLASAQTVIASHEAAFAKLQSERARMVAMEQLNRAVICPRTNLRMEIPALARDGTI
jgi:hypothetical protein